MSETIKVVVVDDHEVVREGLVTMINTQPNMEVVGDCGDADTALEIIADRKPDIVMSDISMPGLSPFEMVKRSKEQNPQLRVLFLTAYSTDGNLERALRAGGSGFITKVEPMGVILEAISKVASGESFFSDEIQGRIVGNQGADEDLTVRRELLSPREVEVLCCVARGLTAKQIANTLHISAKTVERHKSNIMAKLGIHSQVDLARYAIREGLIAP
ncbi:response regulator transcription factor [bacterium]|nr:response regulator transcription factor [bacterium]